MILACGEAIVQSPENAAIYVLRGEAYSGKRDFKKAIADFTKAIEIEPENCEGYHRRAAAYRELGDVENMIADQRKARELDPTYKTAYIHQISNVDSDFEVPLEDSFAQETDPDAKSSAEDDGKDSIRDFLLLPHGDESRDSLFSGGVRSGDTHRRALADALRPETPPPPPGGVPSLLPEDLGGLPERGEGASPRPRPLPRRRPLPERPVQQRAEVWAPQVPTLQSLGEAYRNDATRRPRSTGLNSGQPNWSRSGYPATDTTGAPRYGAPVTGATPLPGRPYSTYPEPGKTYPFLPFAPRQTARTPGVSPSPTTGGTASGRPATSTWQNRIPFPRQPRPTGIRSGTRQ